MKKLNIGQFVYRYVSIFPPKILKFEVVSIHKYKSCEQYHVKCLVCNDHTPCEVLIGYDGDDLKFIQMINNRGTDYDEDDHTFWHRKGYLFYTSPNLAIIDRLEVFISEKKEEILKEEKKLSDLKNKLEIAQADLDGFYLIEEGK